MENITKAVGARIRSLRQRKDLTIEELAFHCAIHPNYLGDIERGRKNLSLESLAKIAEGLHIPISQIFAGDCGNPLKDGATNKLARRLAVLLKNAPPQDREFLVKTAKFLTKRRTRL